MGQPDAKRNPCRQEKITAASHARSSSRFNSSAAVAAAAAAAWFDIRVFYVRVMRCIGSEAPQLLTMCFPARNVEVVLEINGGRISPSDHTCIALRRDRVDIDSEEVTYVSTDNLRISGCFLAFEIYDKHDVLLLGSFKQQQQSSSSFEGVFPRARDMQAWKMDCSTSGSSSYSSSSTSGSSSYSSSSTSGGEVIFKSSLPSRGRNFCGSRHEFSNLLGTCMEVYVVGRYAGTPVILTQTVHLSVGHRRNCAMLDAIPEDEECSNDRQADQEDEVLAAAAAACGKYEVDEDDDTSSVVPVFNKLYSADDMERSEGVDGDEDGEIVSWFNAGVRVGVGIGLGMCLGVGIGVGLLVRTYNATAKSFRRL